MPWKPATQSAPSATYNDSSFTDCRFKSARIRGSRSLSLPELIMHCGRSTCKKEFFYHESFPVRGAGMGLADDICEETSPQRRTALPSVFRPIHAVEDQCRRLGIAGYPAINIKEHGRYDAIAVAEPIEGPKRIDIFRTQKEMIADRESDVTLA
jgi:hypothetical protein